MALSLGLSGFELLFIGLGWSEVDGVALGDLYPFGLLLAFVGGPDCLMLLDGVELERTEASDLHAPRLGDLAGESGDEGLNPTVVIGDASAQLFLSSLLLEFHSTMRRRTSPS